LWLALLFSYPQAVVDGIPESFMMNVTGVAEADGVLS
jgi:hypothetical protein